MKKIINLILPLFYFSSSIAFSQSDQPVISGKIVDVDSGQPILFASIGVLNMSLGTSSNEEGEFVLKVDSFPVQVMISHLNFKKRIIEVRSGGNIGKIELSPVMNTLDEITISEKKKGNEAVKLLHKAYEKVRYSNNREHYGKAFYRQKTKEGNSDFYELYEIFFDAKFTGGGIVDWAIQEGRYALNEREGSNYLYNRNFTLFGRILTLFQPNTDDYVMPVHGSVESLYNVNIKKLLNVGDREIAVIECTVVDGISTPAFNGNVYVDINTYDILKLEGKIVSDELKLIKLTQKGSWSNYVLEYEIAYKPDLDSALLMDYMRVSQSFDYMADNSSREVHVLTQSLLTFYDYYQPIKSKRLGGRIQRSQSDADKLNQLGYNKDFWDQNPIVKRTPVENDVIQAFEAQKAFGTIYLNDKELIVLEKDNLEENPVIKSLISKLRSNSVFLDQEKVFLHFDKDFYSTGETIWFKAYLVEAIRHRPIQIPCVLYVDLFGPEGELVTSRQVKIEYGYGAGQIQLPVALLGGNYQIRAYTEWMKNFSDQFFYRKNLKIYNSTISQIEQKEEQQNIDLQFFPEGGDLVVGLISQVAFKAVAASGKGVPFEGKIVNAKGDTVHSITSNHLGMGSTFLMPRAGDEWHAVISGEDGKYPLPEIKGSGISVSVRYLNSKTIKVALRASPEFEGSKFYLVGQSKGIIYHKSSVVIQRGQALVDIPEAKFPRGILQLTLFDELGKPVLERLVFILTESGTRVIAEVGDTKLKSREEVSVSLDVTNIYGRSLNANLSVAVTDYDMIKKDIYGENITNYLMLKSELKGRIEDPGYYFKDEERSTLLDLDVLMLTQGWRRFDWEQIINEEKLDFKYKRGDGFLKSGVVLNAISEKPLPFHLVTLFSDAFRQSFKTDENGKFKFYNPVLADSTNVIVSITNAKGNNVDGLLKFDEEEPTYLIDSTYRYLDLYKEKSMVLDYLETDQIRKDIEASYGEPVNILPELVFETVKESSLENNNQIYGQADVTIEADEITSNFSNVLQMIQGRAAGVRVVNGTISIRGARRNPLILVDGVPIVSDDGYAGSPQGIADANSNDSINGIAQQPTSPSFGAIGSDLTSQLSFINPNNVDRIDILKGPSASMFGARGGSGVIAIYTKRGVESVSKNSDFDKLVLDGFDVPREFYHPKYGETAEGAEKPDYRVTLYWNPDVVVKDGKADFSFYNSDRAKNLEMVIEGMAEDGSPISFRYNTE